MTNHQISLLIFFILINLFEYSLCEHRQTSNNCPHLFKTLTDCTCVQSNTIDCSYSRTLTHLPRSWRSTNNNLTAFTQSIIRFDLIHTPSITSIKTDDFHGLSNLEYLSIINTGLVHIHPHAFRHLHHLRELRIESNRGLTELRSFALSDIEDIQRISLVANSIRVLHAETFRNTYFVDTIDLTGNPLEIIESYAFNGLKSVGTLILCALPTCPIKQIDPHAFFGFHTCDKIILTGIHTSLYSNSFSFMTSIGLVNLSQSFITHIHSYAFQSSENIHEIDLSYSSISNIDPHAFHGLVNVSLLNLNGNLIRFFEKTIFQELLRTIKEVNLDHNPISCDCSIEWYLEHRSQRFKLPDVCTGPIGYECLSPNELQQSQLPCYQTNLNRNRTNLCEKREQNIFSPKSSAYLCTMNSYLLTCLVFLFCRLN